MNKPPTLADVAAAGRCAHGDGVACPEPGDPRPAQRQDRAPSRRRGGRHRLFAERNRQGAAHGEDEIGRRAHPRPDQPDLPTDGPRHRGRPPRRQPHGAARRHRQRRREGGRRRRRAPGAPRRRPARRHRPADASAARTAAGGATCRSSAISRTLETPAMAAVVADDANGHHRGVLASPRSWVTAASDTSPDRRTCPPARIAPAPSTTAPAPPASGAACPIVECEQYTRESGAGAMEVLLAGSIRRHRGRRRQRPDRPRRDRDPASAPGGAARTTSPSSASTTCPTST